MSETTYKAYPEIVIPEFLRGDAWWDNSWGNDVTAVSEYNLPLFDGEGGDVSLVVWVGHPDPAQRGYPEMPRFTIFTSCFAEDDSVERETDDEAKAAINAAIKKYGGEELYPS